MIHVCLKVQNHPCHSVCQHELQLSALRVFFEHAAKNYEGFRLPRMQNMSCAPRSLASQPGRVSLSSNAAILKTSLLSFFWMFT